MNIDKKELIDSIIDRAYQLNLTEILFVDEKQRQYEYCLDKKSIYYKKIKLFIKNKNYFLSDCNNYLHNNKWQMIILKENFLRKLNIEDLTDIYIDLD